MKPVIIFVIAQCLLWYSFCQIPCLNPRPKEKEHTYNGCGPQGQSLDKIVLNKFLNSVGSHFIECCNNHDLCFGTCQNTIEHFQSCNTAFKNCMLQVCDEKPEKEEHPKKQSTLGRIRRQMQRLFEPITRGYCKRKATVFADWVSGKLGNNAYNNSQRGSCICSKKKFR